MRRRPRARTRLAPPADVHPELLAVLARLDRAFEGLRIPYVVGGSVASTLHGEARMTQDIDVLVDIAPWQVAAVIGALTGFMIDPVATSAAVGAGDAFQAIDAATGWKIDLFPVHDEAADRAQLARRIRVELDAAHADAAWFASPEDIVLRKLDWFRRSGGVLERQLRDVIGVLKVQRGRLDEAYLTEHARRRDLVDLLARARREAGS